MTNNVFRRATDGIRGAVEVETAAGSGRTAASDKGTVLSGEGGTKPFRSLVVEDDFTCRLMLHGLLSKYGECHIALNGLEALKVFEASLDAKEPYHLVCMDIQMPEMNGQEAVTRIRAIEKARHIDGSPVKVLMTTSLNDLKTIFDSFGAQCDDYLVKPVDGKKLEKHLRLFGFIE